MYTTRALAQYAAEGSFDSLPEATIQSAKTATLNILAAAIGGARTTIGEHHVNLAIATGGGMKEASLIGSNQQVSVAMASYANASLAFALDYEDVVHIAIKNWLDSNPTAAKDIERVNVRGLGISRIADNNPSGPVDAMFSLPYTIATTLTRDPLLPEMYAPERIAATEVQELLAKIVCEADEKADLAWFNEHRMCYVTTIKTNNGSEVVLETEFPGDKPDVGWPQIEHKFRELAAGALKQNAIEQVIDMVGSLDELDDVGQLARVLSAV